MHALFGQAARLSFNLRVRDLSRQAETLGTEIPVVRESEFLTEKMTLLNVPTDERFRPMLRVYRFLAFLEPPGTVRLRFYRIGVTPDVLLSEQTLALAGSGIGYAQLASFPPEVLNETAVRIDLELLTPMQFWAFVSVTNNATQHVTIITPQ
ncbi:MAG TPA: hypothetical protein VM779_01865 [Thermoanaerobaculia bacterium]|nr:hypothetical protein [Thermoanaerobaculia bacterium]